MPMPKEAEGPASPAKEEEREWIDFELMPMPKEKERDKGIAEGTYNVKQCEIAASAARAPPTEQCVA